MDIQAIGIADVIDKPADLPTIAVTVRTNARTNYRKGSIEILRAGPQTCKGTLGAAGANNIIDLFPHGIHLAYDLWHRIEISHTAQRRASTCGDLIYLFTAGFVLCDHFVGHLSTQMISLRLYFIGSLAHCVFWDLCDVHKHHIALQNSI